MNEEDAESDKRGGLRVCADEKEEGAQSFDDSQGARRRGRYRQVLVCGMREDDGDADTDDERGKRSEEEEFGEEG